MCLELSAWLSESHELMGSCHLLIWPLIGSGSYMRAAQEKALLSWEGGDILISSLLDIQVDNFCKKQQ